MDKNESLRIFVKRAKPRNPLVKYARLRKSGIHYKSARKCAKMEARFNRDE